MGLQEAFLAICVLACCTCLYVVLTRSARESALIGRLETLERDRANFELDKSNLVERCEEILDRSEHKRRRAAAVEARERAAEDPAGAAAGPAGGTRADQLRLVRARLNARGLMG